VRVAKTAAVTPTRDELVIEHVDVVKSIANRLARRLPPAVETKDLISIGMLGLIDAAGRYRPRLGVPFDAFARRRVLGAMLDELRSLDRAPRSVRRMGRELDATVARLRHELGRDPQEAEIAAAMDMTEAQYQQAVDQLRGVEFGAMRELDATDSQGEPLIALSIGDDQRPDAQLERTEMRGLLADALSELPERERQILSLYYEQELTLKEIGEVIGVCESRVSQLRSLAVSRLRVSMRETLGAGEAETDGDGR
jgi:RNA polymerase sigma factor for flagellar operon FliA